MANSTSTQMKTEAAVHHLRPNPATAYLKKSEQEHEAARRANTDGKSAGGRRASPNGTHPQANRQPGSKKAQQGETVAARKNDSTGVAVLEPLAGAISLPSSLRRAWRRSRRAPRSAGGADREEALRDPLVGVVSPPSSLRGATRRRAWSRGGWALGSAGGEGEEEARGLQRGASGAAGAAADRGKAGLVRARRAGADRAGVGRWGMEGRGQMLSCWIIYLG